ncbi:hypothetical protein SPI_09184 [Niveomyces insectorum RCEF 264]|uniref:Zn(2)-C6 fungal-type domain-containing protein n=1 Tax=Niveomyces insectorum RCEF 264 TaxID=1081102 RepID=A0A167M641_9HYPO|nr:hypothetical protein SPI_09184 [Niveomyces insectorum RCEF 264]
MTQQSQDTSGGSAYPVKKRRACDECRMSSICCVIVNLSVYFSDGLFVITGTRKLACSQEPQGCRRCKREGIACVYSVQKPMGRPRKRPRVGEEDKAAKGSTAIAPSDAAPTQPEGNMGLSSLATHTTSPSINFLDFLGLGDGDMEPIVGQLPLAGLTMAPHMPPLAVSSETLSDLQATGPGVKRSMTYQDAFPKSLFGVNFANLDFGVGSANFSGSGFSSPVEKPGPSNSEAPSGSPGARWMTTSEATATGLATSAPSTGYSPKVLSTAEHGPFTQAWINSERSSDPSRVNNDSGGGSSDGGSSGGGGSGVDGGAEARFDTVAEESARTLALARVSHSDESIATDKPLDAWLLSAPNRVCGCLARLYLALDSLQHLPSDVGAAMSVARTAAHAAHDTIMCPSCAPPNFMDIHYQPPLQAYQNLMILGALLPSIAHTYRRIVTMVDEEAARAAAAKQRLPISLTAYGGMWGHLAEHNNFCIQASALNGSVVEPPLWRLVVRALLKVDVYGIHLEQAVVNGMTTDTNSSDGRGEVEKEGQEGEANNHNAIRDGADGKATFSSSAASSSTSGMVMVHFGLKDIADMMETRARLRHGWMDAAIDAGLIKNADSLGYVRLPPGEKHGCQKVIELAKQEIDKLVIV